jgi:hypothetical protein
VQRPCTLCVRAGVTCTAPVKTTTWKVHEAGRLAKKARRGERNAKSSGTSEHTLCTSPAVRSSETVHVDEEDVGAVGAISSAPTDNQVEHAPWTANSASIEYLEKVSSLSHRFCHPSTLRLSR